MIDALQLYIDRYGRKFFGVFMRTTLSWGTPLLLSLLPLQQGMASNPSKGTSFSPLTISISCGSDTLAESQVQYVRAPGARSEVAAMECVDKNRAVDNILPSAAEVGYSEAFRIWLVVIVLNDKDASAVRKLSVDNVGRLMVVSVNHKALSISQLGSPLRHDKIYINADSEMEAHKLMMLLIKP